MGLDMYLIGEKFFPTDWEHPEQCLTEDGFRLKERRLELGYWRKHPNLHGYIVQQFAQGEDTCQQIHLDGEQMAQIIQAIKDRNLPTTEGFFFGESDGSEDAETIRIFEKAVRWLELKEDGVWKSVVYHASW